MKGILLPRNCFQFSLAKVIINKISFINTRFENTQNDHFLRQAIEKSPENFFQGLRMYHIPQNLNGTDQSDQSHQLLTESDVWRRQTMSMKNGG